jgi:16S rRNA G966 N2-methylase RsmD
VGYAKWNLASWRLEKCCYAGGSVCENVIDSRVKHLVVRPSAAHHKAQFLDPFGGSGTTGLVAQANGCKAILIELNPEYIQIAAKRLSQEVLNFSAPDARQ